MLQWIPSHCGIEGNEKADDLAKLGAEKEQEDNAVAVLVPPRAVATAAACVALNAAELVPLPAVVALAANTPRAESAAFAAKPVTPAAAAVAAAAVAAEAP